MEGLTGNYDLFWDVQPLFASHLYLNESHGRVIIPVIQGKPFQIVGVDAGTGIQAFSKAYDPLPPGDPGVAFVVPTPAEDQEGPYPVFASPTRVEVVDIDAAGVTIERTNFRILSTGSTITVTDDPQNPLDPSIGVSMLNVSRGGLATRSNGAMSVVGQAGDRIVILIGQKEVDPDAPLSVVFSRPLFLNHAQSDAEVDAFLRTAFSLRKAPKSDPAVPSLASAFTDVTANATFRVDSGGRRVTVALPASFERGATYILALSPGLIAADSGSGASGLTLGQARNGAAVTAVLSQPIDLKFTVRDAASLTSFDLPAGSQGSIRDLALNGNVLFISALNDGLFAFDSADPAGLTSATVPLGRVLPLAGEEYWAVASDQHGRVYATSVGDTFGLVRSFRMEDFIGDGSVQPTARIVAPKASAVVSWAPGYSAASDIDTLSSDRPEGIPRKLQLAIQDTTRPYATLADFTSGLPAAGGFLDASIDDQDFKKMSVSIHIEHDNPYASQRITIENVTRDMHWSGDATPNHPAKIDNVIARPTDQMRIVYNERTYGVVTIFGYGIGIFDLNAIDSNASADLPPDYKPMSERVRLSPVALNPACPGQPLDVDAISDLSLSPEVAILPATDANGDPLLKIYGPDVRKGVLDALFQPATASTVQQDPCDRRSSTGLLLSPGHNDRITALDARFTSIAGRKPLTIPHH